MKCRFIVALSFVVVCSVSAQDTAHVKAGWNLIGSVKAGAVPEVLSTLPDSLIISSFWGYTPGVGYESTDTLINGTGYWVKAKSDGLIVFNNAPPVDSCKSKAFIYEGKLYHTVLIGDQCWMAENLDVGVMIDSLQNATDNDTIEKYCYNNDPLNCALYGGFYQWDEAMQYVTTEGAKGICPAGWHIPTYADFGALLNAAGWDGNALKAVGQGASNGTGTNSTGFSALLAGGRDRNGAFYNLGHGALFWSSAENVAPLAYTLSLLATNSSVYLYDGYEGNGFSVRCLED